MLSKTDVSETFLDWGGEVDAMNTSLVDQNAKIYALYETVHAVNRSLRGRDYSECCFDYHVGTEHKN